MEKLFYFVWKKPAESVADWRARLKGECGAGLLENGALSLQLNLADEGVAAGAALRLLSRPVPDGLVAFWMHSANTRAACQAALAESHDRIAGYLVTESRVKDAPPAPPGPDGRSWGFSLVGMLQRPPRLTEAEWLRIWLGSHTAVAVETQPTFRYVQNVVTRPLTEDPPVLGSIVEEGFPIAALSDPAAFYDAVGNPAKHAENHRRMMESCHRFIDFDKIDSIPTSEFVVKALRV